LIGYSFFGNSSTYDAENESNQALEEQGVEVSSSDEYVAQTTHEKRVMDVIEESAPSVVSVLIQKTEGQIYDEYMEEEMDLWGNFYFFDMNDVVGMQEPEDRDELVEVGAGSGFIVSEDGIIITNKHVIADENAVYSVITNDGLEYEAEILDVNPVQDIGVLKIVNTDDKFKALKLGNSSSIQLGQTVIAIGNTLGEFQNTISVGVISGLDRDITAQDSDGSYETLEGIMQTDAAISQGNSGGPLLNLKGEVIGINTAVSLSGENIGFAIPINKAKRDLEQVLSQGEISYPFIGVQYVIINEDIAEEEGLPVDYGALIVIPNPGESPSIVPGAPADQAGIKEGSIILEFNGQKITQNNTLVNMIQEYLPGDVVELRVLKDGEESLVNLTLGNWNDFDF
jgi:S1-C subfamily serine protease